MREFLSWLIEAGLWPNPVVGYIAEQIGVAGTPGEFQGGFARQEIITALKRRISREKYLQRAKVAEWEALSQQYRVLNDVRIHFFRVLGRQGHAGLSGAAGRRRSVSRGGDGRRGGLGGRRGGGRGGGGVSRLSKSTTGKKHAGQTGTATNDPELTVVHRRSSKGGSKAPTRANC